MYNAIFSSFAVKSTKEVFSQMLAIASYLKAPRVFKKQLQLCESGIRPVGNWLFVDPINSLAQR